MTVYAQGSGLDEVLAAIHKRFTYRMQDLGEFMKVCCNDSPIGSTGRIPEAGGCGKTASKSVIVEDGVAAKTISAYNDLNPVRAGMVQDAADYRWNSYGEAIGGGAKAMAKPPGPAW